MDYSFLVGIHYETPENKEELAKRAQNELKKKKEDRDNTYGLLQNWRFYGFLNSQRVDFILTNFKKSKVGSSATTRRSSARSTITLESSIS